MKRISVFAIALVCVGTIFSAMAAAQDESGLLRTAPQSDVLRKYEASAPSQQQAGSFSLSAFEVDQLLQAAIGARINLPGLDEFTWNQDQPLQFKRFEIYAADAHITVLGDQGTFRLSPSVRSFFMTTNSTTAIGLAIDRNSKQVRGYAVQANSQFEISGQIDGLINFVPSVHPDDAQTSCGTELDSQPSESVAFLKDGSFPSREAGASAINWQATVAVDTDTEWMSGKSNNPTVATAWIETLFLSMNVMYERDVSTRLLIGDVILRTGSDPYTVSNDTAAQLNEFAQYWRLNQGVIERDFALALSGKIAANSFSGIAWINQYCQNGFVPAGWTITVGSYSMNRVGSGWSATSAAKFVGHELGHNMGSPHTHCISNNMGGFVDQCYNQGGSGCYSGTQSCPASGPGTAMSYCHLLGGCGSTADFHPIVQSLLEDRLAANNPNCIADFEDPDPAVPSIDIKKEISINGGASWHDANSSGSAPDVDFPSGAEYRITVTNNGEVDLVNVSVADNDLGVVNYAVGDLDINQAVVLTSNDIPALASAEICNTTETIVNTASVNAQSADDGSSLAPQTDDAYLNCFAPASLLTTKEISIDGGTTWSDANSAGTAPHTGFPAAALYRITVTNSGAVALSNVTLSDVALGVSNYFIGNLSIGASVQLGSAVIPALNVNPACTTETTFINTATANGQSFETGSASPAAHDVAMLVCENLADMIFADNFNSD